MNDFYFLVEISFFEKNTKAIVQGFSKIGVLRWETKSHQFLSRHTFICPESTYMYEKYAKNLCCQFVVAG